MNDCIEISATRLPAALREGMSPVFVLHFLVPYKYEDPRDINEIKNFGYLGRVENQHQNRKYPENHNINHYYLQ